MQQKVDAAFLHVPVAGLHTNQDICGQDGQPVTCSLRRGRIPTSGAYCKQLAGPESQCESIF